MEILKAKKQHIEGILSLYKKLFEYTVELEPYFFNNVEQDKGFIESVITDNNSDIFVALDNNFVVGFALVQKQMTPHYDVFIEQEFAYLMDLFVLVEYRGRKIASSLIIECEKWSKEKKVNYIELSVLNKNKNAYELYSKKGFKEKASTMYKMLD